MPFRKLVTPTGGGVSEVSGIVFSDFPFTFPPYVGTNLFGTASIILCLFDGMDIGAIDRHFIGITTTYTAFEDCTFDETSFLGSTVDGETGAAADAALLAVCTGCAGTIILPSGATHDFSS